MQTKLRNKGFTLIELMLIVAIIGILAAIGIQTYRSSQGKARDKAAQTDVRNLMSAITASSVQ